MSKISRRTFLKQIIAAGVTVTLYSNRSFRMAFAKAGPTAYKVRILHTNDHHARIEPVPSGNVLLHGGVSRRKTLIDAQRQLAETDNIDLLLLDAGDVFQGTLYFNQYKGQADLEFYKGMGYQAIAIGNHEFDNGSAALATFIQQATDPAFTPDLNPAGSVATAISIPVISANIVPAAGSTLDGLIQPNTVVTLQKGAAAGKKIGIFGLTPPDTGILSNTGPDLTFIGNPDPNDANADLVALMGAQVAELQSQGANAVIALTHVGYLLDQSLAAKTSGIGLFLGGHSHSPLGPQPNPQGDYPTPVVNTAGESVPVLTDWEWGRWLGMIEVGFDDAGVVSEITGTPVEVIADETKAGYVAPDAAFEARIVNDYKPPLNDLLQQKIGETTVELDGVRANVRTRETNLGSLIADALLDRTANDGATLAMTNGGGIRASIPGPDVTMGDVLTVLPFGNTIAVVTLTGAQVWAALEHGVNSVETASGRFPQVAGMRFSFTADRAPNSGRVLSLEVKQGDGSFAPIDLAANYRLATNDFMLAGGDGYAVLTQGTNPVNTGLIMADEVAAYIGANSPITAETVELGRIQRLYMTWMPVVKRAAVAATP